MAEWILTTGSWDDTGVWQDTATWVDGDVVVLVAGVSATGAVATVQAAAGAIVLVAGVSATGAAGQTAVTGSATVLVTGVAAQGRVGAAIVWGAIIPDPGNQWTDVDPSATTIWTNIAA